MGLFSELGPGREATCLETLRGHAGCLSCSGNEPPHRTTFRRTGISGGCDSCDWGGRAQRPIDRTESLHQEAFETNFG